MVLDAPNPEEVGNEDGLEVYKKVRGDVSTHIPITMPQSFRLGAFLESLSLRHDRAVERLKKLCADVASDRTWDDKVLHTTNLRVEDLEAQVLENLPEWREKLRMELDQVGWAKAEGRDLQVALGHDNSTQQNHEDELTLIFDK